MVRLRHFTSRSSLDRIRSEGVIRAGDSGRVFAVRARGMPGNPRDLERALGIARGRGNAYVEFDALELEFDVVLNPLTGARESQYRGDVDLAERNSAFFLNR